MPIIFTDLIKDKAFAIKNRKQLKEFYELIKKTVKEKKLNLEGHTLPASFNDWIVIIEGDKKLPKRDTDVVDFSIAQDKRYETWRKTYLIASNPILMTQAAKDLLESVQELDQTNKNSMSLMNGNKDDLVTALSDMQAAVAIFLTSYDKQQSKLQLPKRDVALERIKIASAKKTQAATDLTTKIVKSKKTLRNTSSAGKQAIPAA